MTIKQISASAVALIICASASYGQDNNVITIESMKEPAMPIGQYNYREAKQISEDFKLRADSILNSVDYRSMKRPALGQWYIGKNAGDGFLPAFDKNPFAFDYKADAKIQGWNNGALYAGMSRTTYPGLLSIQSGNVYAVHKAGNFTFTANLTANRMLMQKEIVNQFGIGGSATYRFNDNVSATLFGNFYNSTPYSSMGAMPYIGTSSFGGFMTFMQDNAGIDLGAERTYDPYSRRWITVPIVTPKIRINDKFTLDIPLGWLIRDVLTDIIYDKKNHGSPTILPSFPPPVVR